MKHLAASLTLSIMSLFPAMQAHAQVPALKPGQESAVFAGGCFWCMEADFEKLPGVVTVISGYAGGTTENPTYKQVTLGVGGHLEVVKVIYEPAKVSYSALLDHFWKNIDPTVPDRQFCDVGHQYTTAIFATKNQIPLALESLEKVKQILPKVYTQVLPDAVFYPAEEYHQDYYLKNKLRYNYYRYACGRDARLREVWKQGPR